jgi:hypothetical protein
MRGGGPSAYPASTQLIVELRDQGLTWPEIAEQVAMTVSGAWSRTGGPGRQSLHAWVVGRGFSPTHLTRTWRLASVQRSLIVSAEPPPVLNSMLQGEQPTVSPLSVVPACSTSGAPMRTTMQATATVGPVRVVVVEQLGEVEEA